MRKSAEKTKIAPFFIVTIDGKPYFLSVHKAHAKYEMALAKSKNRDRQVEMAIIFMNQLTGEQTGTMRILHPGSAIKSLDHVSPFARVKRRR